MTQVQERNRFTYVLNVYHEQHGEEPVGDRLAVSCDLDLNAESYQRRQIIGEDWSPLDLGWMKPEDVGYVLIQNREGTGYQPVVPSDEELLDVGRRILYVGNPGDSAGWLVPPRHFLLSMPIDVSVLRMRCTHGRAKVRTAVYPR